MCDPLEYCGFCRDKDTCKLLLTPKTPEQLQKLPNTVAMCDTRRFYAYCEPANRLMDGLMSTKEVIAWLKANPSDNTFEFLDALEMADAFGPYEPTDSDLQAMYAQDVRDAIACQREPA